MTVASSEAQDLPFANLLRLVDSEKEIDILHAILMTTSQYVHKNSCMCATASG